jgi:hypothetical protein
VADARTGFVTRDTSRVTDCHQPDHYSGQPGLKAGRRKKVSTSFLHSRGIFTNSVNIGCDHGDEHVRRNEDASLGKATNGSRNALHERTSTSAKLAVITAAGQLA